MNGSIIEVRDLEHWFGEFKAVDGITFSVREGEIFSLLGPNGAGKSTTINVLTTLLPLQKGEVRVAGYDVAREAEAVRQSIGIVFQELTLDRDMTVREILEFHGRLYGMPREERRRRIGELLRLVELEGKRDTLTKHLSGGMKRRLEIARGLMTRPRILFLDEPTLGLDPQTRLRTWDYIEQVNREGTTIFLTTHYMDEADHLSDRISLIDRGRIVVTGSPLELKNALGEDMIYLETDSDRRAVELLRVVDGVRSAAVRRQGISVTLTADGTRILPRIMEILLENGIGVSVVNLKKPSMDDVFVHHTGKALREAEQAYPGS
ncbi:MAG: ATP-binding cassette domain-containing protein [Methanomicrobiales archaeon]|nr:ATP-binding cassette domain-containing protein [Methanomicrobiales archaeon]MDI6876712.1 ATP-binding cassette domain-containing protein [Methanomicrobiales archaeon]